jgi:lysophospholipase L1-like esterase
MVTSNIIPLIKTIRKNPVAKNTPIIFIEQCIIDIGSIHNEFINSVIEKNDELNKQVDKAINKGEKDLFMIKQIGGIDEDSEATVDGIHFNDLGFQRYADHFLKNIKELDIL